MKKRDKVKKVQLGLSSLKKLEASDLTATQIVIATVARFLVWRGSQHRSCAEPEAIWRKGWDSNPRYP